MMSTYISTLAWTSAARNVLPRLQTEITKAQVEISTGRSADLGLSLGVGTGQSVDLHAAEARLTTLKQDHALAKSRLDLTQTALGQISSDTNTFLQNLIAAKSSNLGTAIMVDQAKSGLSAFTAMMNTSDGQRYAFGGENSSIAPLVDYDSGPKAAVNAAFALRFGLNAADPQNDPNIANISASDMEDFLNNEFAALFADPAWGQDWSRASSQDVTTRISTSETVPVSTTANTTAMRNLAMAYTMVSQLGLTALPEAAKDMVLKKAVDVTGAAVSGLTAVSSTLGVSQTRIAAAETATQNSLDVVSARIAAIEGVDPAEAKTRLDTLTTQLQMSYSTTAKIMQLSILNYV
ncbi:flagellar hook-associated family protein [Aquabacter sp. L1I39]|uniref:flagellar hook-associated family protein n=1 Tax=Aquabacter sp. L1I39 TaxID=2820278 RepID=UPI001ADC122F|nr:flagellar hook-associated family protein [Aquabacter sp. L1I39]QTL04309.1 flagellar hook-associated family protein [Aquabacter sp. L1I39]